jgi:probable rRNA maturation factor
LGQKIDRSALRQSAKLILSALGFLDEELSITLTSDEDIAEIAGRYGRPRRPTDVLAFSMLDGEGAEFRGGCLGDVLISVETAARQAAEHGIELADELRTLLIHGVLHLVGMEHATPAQARAMRGLEDHLLWELTKAG